MGDRPSFAVSALPRIAHPSDIFIEQKSEFDHGKSINSYVAFGRTFHISNELICFTDDGRDFELKRDDGKG